jgi:hypothetical protein
MKLFLDWLNENTGGFVNIDLSRYNARANAKAKELLDYAKDKKEKLTGFKLDINLIKNGLKDYPEINQLINSLNNRNGVNWIFDKKMFSWYANFTKNMPLAEKQQIYKAFTHLSDYYESLESDDVDEKEYYEPIKKSLDQTSQNMQVVKNKIEQSIGNLDWNGSKVTIIPELPHSDEEYMPSADDATILVGNKQAIFTYFNYDGKVQIEDILEFDDEDANEYFSNQEEKQDYFNLINQLQNPNRNKEEILTLYTARPIKDRDFYSNTTYIPANVFLSNSFSHVDGLAGDLAGTNERRDIYKVKINRKYLIRTLDGPVKYYQVIQNAPVVSMNLY